MILRERAYIGVVVVAWEVKVIEVLLLVDYYETSNIHRSQGVTGASHVPPPIHVLNLPLPYARDDVLGLSAGRWTSPHCGFVVTGLLFFNC